MEDKNAANLSRSIKPPSHGIALYRLPGAGLYRNQRGSSVRYRTSERVWTFICKLRQSGLQPEAENAHFRGHSSHGSGNERLCVASPGSTSWGDARPRLFAAPTNPLELARIK